MRRTKQAAFFFHQRGSHQQKSFEALLSSVSHQLISTEPRLQKSVIKSEYRSILQKQSRLSLEDLEYLFDIITRQREDDIDLVLFLDALDEFDGPQEHMASFIRDFTKRYNPSSNLQICCSSRPLNSLIEIFGKCPGFEIHEHTGPDIEAFTNGKFAERPGLLKALNEQHDLLNDDHPKVVDGVVQRARGVFLWVNLAVDELLRLYRDGATPRTILSVLSDLPDELQDFYELIIGQIPVQYRIESYIILEMITRSPFTLTLRSLKAALDFANEKEFERCERIFRRGSLSEPCMENVKRLIRSRTGGLVDIVNEGAEYHRHLQLVQTEKVELMHHTVKEFIEQPGFRQKLLDRDCPMLEGNGYTYLSRYSLGRISGETFPKFNYAGAVSEGNYLLHVIFARDCAYLSEDSTGLDQLGIIDKVNWEPYANESGLVGTDHEHVLQALCHSPLQFALSAGLKLYIDKKNGPGDLLGP